jgi:hypothetical protein
MPEPGRGRRYEDLRNLVPFRFLTDITALNDDDLAVLFEGADHGWRPRRWMRRHSGAGYEVDQRQQGATGIRTRITKLQQALAALTTAGLSALPGVDAAVSIT